MTTTRLFCSLMIRLHCAARTPRNPGAAPPLHVRTDARPADAGDAGVDTIAQAAARAMEATLEGIDGDPEPSSSFRRAQLLDMTEKDDFPVERIEARDGVGDEARAPTSHGGLLGVDEIAREQVRSVERSRRAAMHFAEPEALTPDDGEEPARDRRCG